MVRPTSVESRNERHMRDSVNLGHSCGTSCNAINSHKVVPFGVPSLSLGRSPLAILRGIAFVIIKPFKTFTQRANAHVSVKVLKLHPSFAYGNASASVPVPTLMGWKIAPPQHCLPNGVNASGGHSVSFWGDFRRHGIGSFNVMFSGGNGDNRTRHAHYDDFTGSLKQKPGDGH